MQKKTMLRLFLGLEIFIFGWLYYSGSRGVLAVHELKKENDYIVAQIEDVQKELSLLDHQIVAWNNDSFFAEKIAREELHMAHVGDEIYVLD
jgi:cell division protein FtsB